MTKKNLRNDLVVELRNGQLFNFSIEGTETYFTKYGVKISVDTYNDDLTHKKFRQLTVKRIYKQKDFINVNDEKENVIDKLELLFERED